MLLCFLMGCTVGVCSAAAQTLSQEVVSTVEKTPEKTVNLQVIPLPAKIKPLDGQFALTEKTQIYYDESSGSQDAAVFLADWLKLPTPVKQNPPQFPNGSVTFVSPANNENYPEGGYKIIISQEHVKILSSNPSGWFYGAQTLRQMFWDKKT
ncbi:MAG: glycoside hydrolase family 20 zincin-like fold domain-containing protein, partial [Planctomycetaceae bacterium]|nr:glycoside hydrolase family 20 zincin-like fold domain-containing protein [Planctomycetaceae bacterium]